MKNFMKKQFHATTRRWQRRKEEFTGALFLCVFANFASLRGKSALSSGAKQNVLD
jgi:hypothetical protein